MRAVPTLVLSLFLFAPSHLAAAAADLSVKAFTLDRSSSLTGDRFTATVVVRNNGPDAVTAPNVSIGSTSDLQLLPRMVSRPPAWSCSSTAPNCFVNALEAGGELTLTTTLLAPSFALPGSMTVHALVASNDADPDLSNDRRELPLALLPASRQADLSVSVTASASPVATNSPAAVTYTVRNAGPAAVQNVLLAIRLDHPGSATAPLDVKLNGQWNCTVEPLNQPMLCSRAELAPGMSSSLELRFTTPSAGSTIYTEGTVFADDPHVDSHPSNLRVSESLSVGDATQWSRILLPLTTEIVRGAGGSEWRSELTALIDAAQPPSMQPSGCGPLEAPCMPPPLRRMFDPRNEDLVPHPATGSQFVYIDRNDAASLRLATRVYDAARETLTAGAFVASPRDEKFSSRGFSLVGIPTAEEFRIMLRIYDYDARDAAEVIVELYGDQENVPFSSSTHALSVAPGFYRLTTALLPSHPATAQLDLTPRIASGDHERVRVSVRPVDGSVRIWGLVSISNNETHHVTIVQP